jgi:simple sugar transport system permease protein
VPEHDDPPEQDDGGVDTKPPEATAEIEAPEEEPRAAHEETAAPPSAGTLVVGGRGGWRQAVLIPLLAFITALAVGAIVIIFTEPESLTQWKSFFRDPLDAFRASGTAVANAYKALFTGALGSPSRYREAFGTGELTEILRAFGPVSETLLVATPLIFAGLSVALGFRAGLFNIGAEGQITAGAMLASVAGFSFGGLPGPIHLALIVAAGFVGGAAWGFIPGILKAKTGAHEVITTIMLNFVAANLALYFLNTTFFQRPDRTDPISKPAEALYPRLFGSSLRLHAGLLVAVGVAVIVAWLLNRTTWGFEFRAVGANPSAARAAGMSPAWTYATVMALAGGLAGLGGANQIASVTPSLTPGFSSGYGFDAIALALLGRARPSGVVLAAILFGILRGGSRAMQAATQTPVDIVTVIQALIIMFIAAPALVRAIYRIRARRAVGAEVFTKGWSG